MAGLHAQHRGHRAAAAGRGGGQAAAGRRAQLRGDGGRHRQHRPHDRRGERQRGGAAARQYDCNQLYCNYTIAQWANSGFFVQWVYWVYLFSQNTRSLHCAPTVQCCNAMYELV